jgi:hypothetical protein
MLTVYYQPMVGQPPTSICVADSQLSMFNMDCWTLTTLTPAVCTYKDGVLLRIRIYIYNIYIYICIYSTFTFFWWYLEGLGGIYDNLCEKLDAMKPPTSG